MIRKCLKKIRKRYRMVCLEGENGMFRVKFGKRNTDINAGVKIG